MWLDLYVDERHRRRLSASLYEQIREAIALGRLTAGDRLPTSRQLAAELGVARSSVATIYGRLVAEGILDARTGDGTFVRWSSAGSAGAPQTPAGGAIEPRRTLAAPRRSTAAHGAIDLRTGRPDSRLFPLVAWRRSVVSALQVPPPGYGDPAGLPELRAVLASWIRRSRGVVAEPANVVVTAGAQHAFDLIGRVVLADGDTIAVENPGYPEARRSFSANGLRVVPVPVDDEGIVVEAIPPSARAVYVTPSHQSPTGTTMSADRRRALLDFASHHEAAIIEDDYDTEFRYLDRPFEPIQRLDDEGRVLYVGTFSKTLSPSLRLGFLVVPERLAEAIARTRHASDAQPPHLTQAALADFIGNGHLDRHLRRSRRAMAARHEFVTSGIERLLADGLIAAAPPSHAGLHALIELHQGTDAAEVAAGLVERGVAIDPSDDWWLTPPRPGLLIGFGMADCDELAIAFDRLRTQLSLHRGRPAPAGR